MLIPGLPSVGLDHQTIWLEVEGDGTLIHRGRSSRRPDPDVAVLAGLLVA